jgi:hypothetical protein
MIFIMVRIFLEHNGAIQFAYDTPVTTHIRDMVLAFVQIFNLRLRLGALITSIEDIVINGPLKYEEFSTFSNGPKINGSDVQEELKKKAGFLLNASFTDRTLMIIGNTRKLIYRDIDEMTYGESLTVPILINQTNLLKELFSNAYYYGFSKFEPVRVLLEAKMDAVNGYYIQELHDAFELKDTTLAFSDKQLIVTKLYKRASIKCRFHKAKDALLYSLPYPIFMEEDDCSPDWAWRYKNVSHRDEADLKEEEEIVKFLRSL